MVSLDGFFQKNVKIFAVCGILILMCMLALAIGFGSGLSYSTPPEILNSSTIVSDDNHISELPLSFSQFEAGRNLGPSGRGWGRVGKSDSVMGTYSSAAVSADGLPCATIAKDILQKNGTAADAAIAGLFCLGVINTQSMGLGGGFLLTYYHRATKTAHVLDGREVAPLAATLDMFGGDACLSSKGGLSVAVPGELRGYRELYLKFGGGVPWADLLEPSIRLCERGHRVNWHMARALRYNRDAFVKEPTMSVFIDPSTGDVYQEGSTLRRPALSATLRQLQRDPDALYTGALSSRLLEDLRAVGSLITARDLKEYRPRWRTPVEVSLSNGDFTLYSVPPPGSGVLLGLILNILDDYNIGPASVRGGEGSLTYQRFVEALKYAYARRTQLGDEDFEDMTTLVTELQSESVAADMRGQIGDQTFQDPRHYGAVTAAPPDDSGTGHLSLLAANGDAVTVTSTINQYFGAGLRSVQTGIVLNDEMDDFSAPSITNYFGIPPSPANFIKPGKRPLSSMSPAVVVDAAGDARLVLGAAGGTKIPSGVAGVIINKLWLGKNVKQAIDARRIHHQLYPMIFMYEKGFNQSVVDALSAVGHRVEEFDVGGSVVCAVAADSGHVTANSDFRKSGHVDGY